MPIYAFTCAACGHSYDRLQKMSDPDPVACPVCAAAAVQRQLTAPSFRLSGSGWYETDFKKGGDKQRNLTEKGEGASSGATAPAESKAEPKVESKGESKGGSKGGPKGEAKGESRPEPKPAAKAAADSA